LSFFFNNQHIIKPNIALLERTCLLDATASAALAPCSLLLLLLLRQEHFPEVKIK